MNRSVHAVTAGAFAHRVAETFYDLTVPLLVLQLSGSAVLMGVMYGLGFVAELLVSVFGGALVDRMDRRRLLLTVASAEVAVMAGAGAVYSVGLMTVPLLLGFAFVADGLVRLSLTCDQSVLPQLVDREDLPQASGQLQMALSAAQACGPVVAGACIAVVGLGGTLWVTAGVFLPLLWLVYQVRWPARGTGAEPDAGVVAFVKDNWVGLRITFGEPRYRAILLWRGVFDFVVAAIYLMLLFYFQHERHLSGPELGITVSCGAVGGLAAGAVFARVQARFRSGRLLFASASAIAAAAALLPLATMWPLLGLLFAVMMFFGGVVGRLTALLFQSTVPAEYLGRVYGATQLIGTLTGPISVVLAAVVAARYGAGVVFYVGAAVIVMLVVLTSRSDIARSDWRIARRGAEASAAALPSMDQEAAAERHVVG